MTKQLIEKLKKTIREQSFDSDDSHRPYPIDVLAVSVIEDILKAYDKELRAKVEVRAFTIEEATKFIEMAREEEIQYTGIGEFTEYKHSAEDLAAKIVSEVKIKD